MSETCKLDDGSAGTCANPKEISSCLRTSCKQALFFLVVIGATVALLGGPQQCFEYSKIMFANNTSSESAKSSSSCSQCTVKKIVPIGEDEFKYDSATLKNAFMNPSKHFFHQWHLAEVDRGGFSFDACAPFGGLVVYLVDNPNDSGSGASQQRGYAVVLDNKRSPSESYISSVPGFPSKHPRSRVNRGFKINDDSNSCVQYWVVYDRGTLLVGSGDKPEENATTASNTRLIVCLQNDDAAPPNLYYFGFGLLSKDEQVGVSIKNIRTFDAPPNGCQWSAMVPQQCSALTPL